MKAASAIPRLEFQGSKKNQGQNCSPPKENNAVDTCRYHICFLFSPWVRKRKNMYELLAFWDDHMSNKPGDRRLQAYVVLAALSLHEHALEPWYCKTHESNTNKREQRRLREKKRPKEAVGLSR